MATATQDKHAFGTGYGDQGYADEVRTLLRAAARPFSEQEVFADPFSAGQYHVDFVTTEAGGATRLVEIMYQGVRGTAEQKVPFKAMQLVGGVVALNRKAGRPAAQGAHAYLVLAGAGYAHAEDWAVHVPRLLRHGDGLTICTWEQFLALFRSGRW
jgi:hypothetical protein